jgi:hypothetical protein
MHPIITLSRAIQVKQTTCSNFVQYMLFVCYYYIKVFNFNIQGEMVIAFNIICFRCPWIIYEHRGYNKLSVKQKESYKETRRKRNMNDK